MDRAQLPSPREFARHLGGEVRGDRIYFPGIDHSPSDRSGWVKIDPDAPGGFIAGTFSPRDDWQAIKDHVRERLGLPLWRQESSRQQPTRRTIHPDTGQQERTESSLAIWCTAAAPHHTVAEAYLGSRGLSLDIGLARALRFHGGLYFEGRTVGGIVALMRDIHTNEPCGVHRTFLDSAGRKLDRKMLGRAKGAAIKLDANEDVTLCLHIGEGIETCLTARQQGFRPVWALGSAGAIASFPVLAGIEALTILTERDDSGANRRAVDQCARRYLTAGCEVWLIDPPRGDLNDVLPRAA